MRGSITVLPCSDGGKKYKKKPTREFCSDFIQNDNMRLERVRVDAVHCRRHAMGETTMRDRNSGEARSELQTRARVLQDKHDGPLKLRRRGGTLGAHAPHGRARGDSNPQLNSPSPPNPKKMLAGRRNAAVVKQKEWWRRSHPISSSSSTCPWP